MCARFSNLPGLICFSSLKFPEWPKDAAMGLFLKGATINGKVSEFEKRRFKCPWANTLWIYDLFLLWEIKVTSCSSHQLPVLFPRDRFLKVSLRISLYSVVQTSQWQDSCLKLHFIPLIVSPEGNLHYLYSYTKILEWLSITFNVINLLICCKNNTVRRRCMSICW